MPVSNLNANAAGYQTMWWYSGSSLYGAWAASGGEYSASNAAGDRGACNCENLPTDAEAVTQVRSASRASDNNGSGALQHFVRYSGSNSSDAARSPGLSYQSYTYGYATHATAPGGSGWTPAIVNATEVGMYCSAHEVYLDHAYLEVTWEAGGGSFALFVSCLVGALGPMLTRGDWLALRSHLRALGHRFTEMEWARLIREVRAWGSPRRFDLAAGRA